MRYLFIYLLSTIIHVTKHKSKQSHCCYRCSTHKQVVWLLVVSSCKHAVMKRSHFGGSPEFDSTGFRSMRFWQYTLYSNCKAFQRYILLILHELGTVRQKEIIDVYMRRTKDKQNLENNFVQKILNISRIMKITIACDIPL